MSLTPRTRRAIQSFDNLVALANYQERLKEARKMVWRDRGEPVVELYTLQDCIKHAAMGGFRTWVCGLVFRGADGLRRVGGAGVYAARVDQCRDCVGEDTQGEAEVRDRQWGSTRPTEGARAGLSG